MVLPEIGMEDTMFIAENITALLASAEFASQCKTSIPLTASIGTASYPERAGSPEELIALAAVELQQAREAGDSAISLKQIG